MSSKLIHELPYCADSAGYMRALATFELPAYLDSANFGGKNGRRDVLAAEPVAYLCIEDGKLSCSENAAEFVGDSIDTKELLLYIRQLRNLFIPTYNENGEEPSVADHCGAILGYLGYPVLHNKSKFRIHDAFVGVYRWTLVVDHEQKNCSLRFHATCSDETIERICASVKAALRARKLIPGGGFHLSSDFTKQSSLKDYSSAFSDIKTRIERGDCYQVNLTQCFKTQCQGKPLDAYLKLREATAAPFSAYIDWGAGALLSLSPERFLSLQGKRVLTQPIKGTRPRGASEEEDARLATELICSEKDRAENLMIVDLLRNDLGRVCETGSIQVNQLFTVESFSNVHHLVSAVSGQLSDGMDAMDLLENCFPGGSITGAPKLSAMHVIQEVEQAPRRAYCGTVFCWSADGSFDSNITIRSLLWQQGELSCWAGGGIVADSICAEEYRECFDKIDNIFSALQD